MSGHLGPGDNFDGGSGQNFPSRVSHGLRIKSLNRSKDDWHRKLIDSSRCNAGAGPTFDLSMFGRCKKLHVLTY